jgi:uncharacterized YigZ family protein
MVTSFATIKSASEGLYKEKGSKFIALAIPVMSVAEVDDHLSALRKKYHDARHHCYAYILKPEADVFRANDDGEPNHSAGDPILGQIRSFKLTNVLVIVVRYFGGTKLGVSGLINAYKTSTKNALENASIITRKVTMDVTLLFPYKSTNEVMKLLDEVEIKIGSQKFDNDCKIAGTIPVQNADLLKSKVELLNNLGMELSLIV